MDIKVEFDMDINELAGFQQKYGKYKGPEQAERTLRGKM